MCPVPVVGQLMTHLRPDLEHVLEADTRVR